MFMGDIASLNEKQKFRDQIKLHPQSNRMYGIDHTYWTGILNDGRDRSNQPYYCPIGSGILYMLLVTFVTKFKGWFISYHGTKFAYGLSILLSGLKPAKIKAHGSGIYASPSINYACHPRYSEIKKIDSSYQKNYFKSGKKTLRAGTTIIDSNISNNIIEWVINDQNNDIVDFNDPDFSIICTGMMLRVTDNHPGLLPESQWWYKSHLCNNQDCCCLAIDINDLTKQKDNGDKCNILYE